MAHYALINDSNVVVQVITGRDESDLIEGVESWETYYSKVMGLKAIRTSYHTKYVYDVVLDDSEPPKVISRKIVGSTHDNGGTPFRGKYAAIGDVYDAVNDVFVAPPVEEDATE